MLIVFVLSVCGVLVAALVIAYGQYSQTHWVPAARWVGLALYTVIVFGAAMAEHRRSWGLVGFWGSLGGLLTLHLVAYSLLLAFVDEWRLVWFVPLSIAETPVVMSILDTLGYIPGGRRRAA